MINKIINKIRKIKRLGVYLVLRIAIERSFFRILAKIFNFHPWHADASISARPYRHIVAQLVNELYPDTVVEVGCGLGEILIRIKAREIHGYDVDEGVVRAARFLYGNKVRFIHGSLTTVFLKKIDVLILINWIHEISPSTLEEQLTPLLPHTKYLLLDALDSDVPGYKHNFQFLQSKVVLISTTRPKDERRNIHLFEVLA